MSTIVWSGVYNAQTIRVVDKGAGQTPRMAVEYQGPSAAMGELSWLPYAQFDIGLIVQISLALGIIH